ncbi:hypothetical protein PP715_19070 [Ralstonia solanacearum]|uniref:hypothetical protein n=1 Tax=Ralstonia solanacearum TaxID=305 RepID=UPI000779A0AB|nr:hypothetical protein [Ralstonia solanacearum]AMP72575.1 hypothetical protein UW163_23905 [Ralstonia solanacearum]MCL9841449.1 hypothetical protein [Ralstonia solanacearum]MDB0533815.1 hypothetical protein [Ralstonia solanacearum]MDB0538522.1 hypothetical protein [Ralstonia solanacearum]MDB0548430.1 hypothetical protein [Ralstonia solanacearum]
MRKIHLAWAALAMSGGANAQLPGMAEMQLAVVHDELQHIGAQLAKLQAPQNAHTFCFFGGQAYLIGAVRDGWRCEGAGVRVSTLGGALEPERSDPLRWGLVSRTPAGPDAAKAN